MEKLKDFIYDKSDLLVALLIVGVAALVIWIGINNIMEPYTGNADSTANVEAEKDPESADSATVEEEGTAESTTAAALDEDGVTTKAAQIIIQEGETSEQVAEKLLAAGVIQSKSTFFVMLDRMKLAEKLQAGQFDIPAGSSLEDIIHIITRTH